MEIILNGLEIQVFFGPTLKSEVIGNTPSIAYYCGYGPKQSTPKPPGMTGKGGDEEKSAR